MTTFSTTTTDLLISGTNYDKRWISFFVTAKASGGTAYDGSAESFRYYVVRQKPECHFGQSTATDMQLPAPVLQAPTAAAAAPPRSQAPAAVAAAAAPLAGMRL
jgi:hypothetical protein